MATLHCDYLNGDDTTGTGTSLLPWKKLQRCINVAVRGDTINVADTAAQLIDASLTWNTGYTNSGNGFLTIKAWDNGGALTIQRPDEASPRVGAEINGNGQASVNGSAVANVMWKDIRFTNTTNRALFLNENSGCNGCEFIEPVLIPIGITNNGVVVTNSYFHDITTPWHIIDATGGQGSLITYNYFSDNLPSTSHITTNSYYHTINGNIFKQISAVKLIDNVGGLTNIIGNTFISSGSDNAVAISDNNPGYSSKILNNIFYNYSGAGAKPINYAANVEVNILGHNGYFNSNANSANSGVGIDLTDKDITGAVSPFTDIDNNDFSLIEAHRGGALYNGVDLDIGAVQSAGSGGGGSSEFSFASIK